MVVETPHEAVHVIEDWYDGPCTGYADYQRTPHFYRSLYLDWDNSNVYNPAEDRFELTSVSEQAVEWAVARHQLWLRWSEAFRAGTLLEGADDDVRILPEDRVRDQELRDLIEQQRSAQAKSPFVVRGKFELGCRRVQWYEIGA